MVSDERKGMDLLTRILKRGRDFDRDFRNPDTFDKLSKMEGLFMLRDVVYRIPYFTPGRLRNMYYEDFSPFRPALLRLDLGTKNKPKLVDLKLLAELFEEAETQN